MHVFVYGSLKKGFNNHYRLSEHDAMFVGDAVVKGVMFSLGGFPGVDIRGSTDIRGEIYKIDEKCLSDCDSLEGYHGEDSSNNFYNREKVETSLGPAWIYTLDKSDYEASSIIKSGEWV